MVDGIDARGVPGGRRGEERRGRRWRKTEGTAKP
jgi:hypothetical protein